MVYFTLFMCCRDDKNPYGIKLIKNNSIKNKTSKDSCSICLSELSDRIVVTPCKHYFHDNCLR